jgi:hypothetical protein
MPKAQRQRAVAPISGAYRYERDMMSQLKRALPAALLLRRPPTVSAPRIAVTPSIGLQIPDILIGLGVPQHRTSLRSLTYVDAAVLATIDVLRRSEIGDIQSRVNIGDRALRNSLRRLESHGIIGHTRADRYLLSREYSRSRIELVAVEVKLRRWREALDQAVRYSKFADRTYVVLDASQFNPERHIVREFSSRGIGLLIQAEETVQLIRQARRSLNRAPDWFVALRHVTER